MKDSDLMKPFETDSDLIKPLETDSDLLEPLDSDLSDLTEASLILLLGDTDRSLLCLAWLVDLTLHVIMLISSSMTKMICEMITWIVSPMPPDSLDSPAHFQS